LLLAVRSIDGEEFGSDDIRAIDTLEALKVIDRTEGPDERTVHGECAGRTCPSKNDGRLVRQNTAKSMEVEGGDRGAGRKSVYRREEKTHETKVALLVEVTDGGGRLSTGLEEAEWEDPDAPLSRLADVPKYSDEEG
jgi:hypothetical protein